MRAFFLPGGVYRGEEGGAMTHGARAGNLEGAARESRKPQRFGRERSGMQDQAGQESRVAGELWGTCSSRAL